MGRFYVHNFRIVSWTLNVVLIFWTHNKYFIYAACFLNSAGSVFCGCLSRDGKLAATGGEDDMAYLWDTSSGEINLKCTGHKDSVIFTGFNHDDTLLATGDMSGNIKVWKIEEKNVVWDFDMGDATVSWTIEKFIFVKRVFQSYFNHFLFLIFLKILI